MPDELEKLIKFVYRSCKPDELKDSQQHPDEEALACFLEDKLSKADADALKAHIISCEKCAELIAASLRLKTIEEKDLPEELRVWAKDQFRPAQKVSLLEIFLKLKEKTLEIIKTTGDVLVGQELVPAPVLRSRNIKDFQDEITILKDFENIRVEAKIVNKQAKAFSLSIMVKDKATQKIMKDLRVTLIKDDLELESYLTDSGKVIFEHVLLGKYTVEISNIENKIASVLLDVKI